MIARETEAFQNFDNEIEEYYSETKERNKTTVFCMCVLNTDLSTICVTHTGRDTTDIQNTFRSLPPMARVDASIYISVVRNVCM